MQRNFIWTFAFSALLSIVLAHPGHEVEVEALERREFISRASNLHSRCGEHLAARGLDERASRRRQELAQSFRSKRKLSQWPMVRSRDLSGVLGKDHHSNLTGMELNTDADSLFGDQSSCLLQPEATEGPYYITGEYVRVNMTETQAGIPLVVDMQVIDVNTCKPFPKHYVEFWHCNATGVYSGVVANGNGNAKDASNVNATFLRAIQATDDEGVVQIETIFPGHYSGRATHIHILVHGEGTLLANETLSGGSNVHVGQLFFDQTLISEVEKASPYSENKQSLTKNSADGILAGEARSTDPMVEYVYAGADVEDGIIAWITVGINGTLTKDVAAAGNYGADGGGANSGDANGNGGRPSGAGTSPSPGNTSTEATSTATEGSASESSSSGSSSTTSPAGASTTSNNASPQLVFNFAKYAIGSVLGLLV